MKLRDDGVYEIDADVLPFERSQKIGDNVPNPALIDGFMGKKAVALGSDVEDEDPYWNRWGGGELFLMED